MREDYPKDYALYAFDVSPDLADEGHLNLVKQGTVRVELKFGAALPNTVTIIASIRNLPVMGYLRAKSLSLEKPSDNSGSLMKNYFL